MCTNDSAPQLGLDPELNLTLIHRNNLARSLLLRTGCRGRAQDAARSFRTLSQLGAGLARQNAGTGDAAIPRLLADAARRVREHAARQAGLEP